MTEVFISPEEAFDPNIKTGPRVRKVIKETLFETGGIEIGIVPARKNLKKRATVCQVSSLLRAPNILPKTGVRALTVSQTEVCLEIRPSHENPGKLNCRIICGNALKRGFDDELANIFARVQREGYFEKNYALGLEQIVRQFVMNRIRMQSSYADIVESIKDRS